MKKVIFIIGAGKGLGNGVAEKFGNENFKIVLMARNSDRLKNYAAEFAAKGIDVDTQSADVSKFDDFAKIFAETVQTHGTPDAIFYNVGITAQDDNVTAQTLIEHYITDVAGAYNCIKLADTAEFAEKHGAILITGGGLALQPHASYLPLSMDKAALRAMVQALTPVLTDKGIYIGTVQVTGVIGSSEHFSPKAIAAQFWKLYTERTTHEIIY